MCDNNGFAFYSPDTTIYFAKLFFGKYLPNDYSKIKYLDFQKQKQLHQII